MSMPLGRYTLHGHGSFIVKYFQNFGMTLRKEIRLREAYSGKVMGLCAYGNDFDFNLEDHKMYATSRERMHDFPFIVWQHWDNVLETSFRQLKPEHKAYVVQKNFEFAILDYFKMLKEETLLDDNLCLAGGVFLNVLANSVLKQSGLSKNIHIPPIYK